MSMTTLEYDTITNAAAACSMILTDLQPKLAQFQQVYDSEGGVKMTLTQEEMDAVASLSGLTKTQLDDAMYALTAVLLPGITSGYSALSALASRYRGFAPPMPMTPSVP